MLFAVLPTMEVYDLDLGLLMPSSSSTPVMILPQTGERPGSPTIEGH